MSKKPRWTTITSEEIKEVEKSKSLKEKEKEKKGKVMARRPRWTTIKSTELKKIEKNMVEIKCAFCKGTGKDPFGLSKLSDCPICHGKGTVKVSKPYEKCRACDGTGVYIRSHMYCWYCKGKGVVAKGSQG